jgi:hypothetical protein
MDRKLILVILLFASSCSAQIMQQVLGTTPAPAGGGSAVITRVQSISNASAGTVTSLSTTIGSSVAAGDLLLIDGMFGSGTGTFAVTDSATVCTNTWNQVTGSPLPDGGGSPNEAFAFWTVNCGTQAVGLTANVTVTSGGTHSQRQELNEYHSTTGWPATPIDQHNTATNSTGTITGAAANITPSVTNTLISSVLEINGTVTAASFTVTSPCIRREGGATAGTGYGSANKIEGGDNLSATNSAQTCTFNWTTSNGWGVIISNYKPN